MASLETQRLVSAEQILEILEEIQAELGKAFRAHEGDLQEELGMALHGQPDGEKLRLGFKMMAVSLGIYEIKHRRGRRGSRL